MRRIIATKELVRGKHKVTKGRTNFAVSQIRLEEGIHWRKVYHICLKPYCLPYLIHIRLMGTL